jgi:hypothetical protein
MTRPISPDEIADAKVTQIPASVIEAFNKLLALNFSGGAARVKQDDVIAEIMLTTQLTRREIIDKGYLNVEEVFRSAGWKVKYDKPDWTETYPAVFEFRK